MINQFCFCTGPFATYSVILLYFHILVSLSEDVFFHCILAAVLHYVLYTQNQHLASFFQYFRGNRDRNTIVYNSIIPSIRARFLRIHPWSWHGHISMRVELFGCALGEAMCERFINTCFFPSALCCFCFVCFFVFIPGEWGLCTSVW